LNFDFVWHCAVAFVLVFVVTVLAALFACVVAGACAEVKVKVKVTRNRPRRSRGDRVIALPFLDLGTRRGLVVSTTPRPLYPRERAGTHCTGACAEVVWGSVGRVLMRSVFKHKFTFLVVCGI
jgi:hypothetical protein